VTRRRRRSTGGGGGEAFEKTFEKRVDTYALLRGMQTRALGYLQ